MEGLTVTAIIIMIVALVALALVVMVMAAVATLLWCVFSVLRLLPQFYFAVRNRHASQSWPPMLFYLVAPTGSVVLGVWLTFKLEAVSYVPHAETALADASRSVWLVMAVTLGALVVVAMMLSAVGVYVSSFSWSLRAYRERGFNVMTLLQLCLLLVTAFLVLPLLAWAGLYPL